MAWFPRWLLVGGFVAGFPVFWGVRMLLAPNSFDPEDLLWTFAFAYAPFVGGALLVPWVLLPVVANRPRQVQRVISAVLASLLPVTVVNAGVLCVFVDWDIAPRLQLALRLSTASWFLPAIGALAYTAAHGTGRIADGSKKTNPVVIGAACVVAPVLVGASAILINWVAGWVTRTESPDAEQVAYAREFLLIDPELEIEPLAYYSKDGMDYMVRFKFIARTQDPARIFEPSLVDPSKFRADFDFPPGEEQHNEKWWDISARSLTGGRVRTPNGNTLNLGYAQNDNDTFTVYVWRHE